MLRELRRINDRTTNTDRIEPDLNEAAPGDERDTSTPRQLGQDLRTFAFGAVLSPARRQKLTDLLIGNTTGGPYIRAGVPAGRPLIIAIQSDRGVPGAPSDDALLAEATKAVVATLS